MSIATEISRLQTAKANIKSAIEDKGVAVPSSATLDTYDEYISAITTGGGYQILDYIQSDGTFYIPTGIYLTSDMWYDYKFKVTTAPESGVQKHLFSGDYFRVAQIGSTGNFYVRRGGDTNRLLVSADPKFTVGTELNVVAFKGGNDVFVNGVSRGSVAADSTTSDRVDAWFFSVNNTSDIATYGIVGQLFYMKIGTGSTLLYNFVPAKRISDDNVGLLDIVNNTFYPSVTPEYFRITNRTSSNGTITITKATNAPAISYRTKTSGGSWSNVVTQSSNTTTVTLPMNDYVEFSGFNPSGATSTANTYNIKVNVAHNVSGDLSTFIQTPYYPAFFQDNVNLVDASGLILPGDNLANDAYFRMFYGCTGLTSAPAELPAMSIADRCYSQMFRNDTSLVNAPALPATSLTNSCYEAMFASCSSLATGPDLKAKVLNVKSYQNTFYGCSSLSSVVCLATDISATNCLNAFMSGVGSGGTLYCDSTMVNEWTSRVPSGWSVQVYSE